MRRELFGLLHWNFEKSFDALSIAELRPDLRPERRVELQPRASARASNRASSRISGRTPASALNRASTIASMRKSTIATSRFSIRPAELRPEAQVKLIPENRVELRRKLLTRASSRRHCVTGRQIFLSSNDLHMGISINKNSPVLEKFLTAFFYLPLLSLIINRRLVVPDSIMFSCLFDMTSIHKD